MIYFVIKSKSNEISLSNAKANETAADSDSTDSEESNKVEDDSEASEDDVEEDMPKARSARKKTPSKTAVSTPVKDAAADDDFVESIGKISIKDKFKSYNFNTYDPTFFRQFTKKNVNYVELDFFVGLPVPDKFISVDIVNDGMAI